MLILRQLLSFALIHLLLLSHTFAEPLTRAEIDKLVENAMSEFDVPGIAVGIISGDELVHLEGYGLRELGKKAKVNKHSCKQTLMRGCGLRIVGPLGSSCEFLQRYKKKGSPGMKPGDPFSIVV